MRAIFCMLLLATAVSVGMPLCAEEFAEQQLSVVASVGGRTISRVLLDDAVNQALNATYYHGKMSAERKRELELDQIEDLVRRELNILGALDRGMDYPEKAAEEARFKIEERLGRENYEGALKSASMTRSMHRQALAETLLAKLAYERFVLIPAEVSDAEIRLAFDAAPDHWRVPESTKLQHILLKVGPGDDEKVVNDVRRQAESLVERLKAGQDFGDLAAEFSQDMYRIKGGSLGWIYRGSLVAPVEESVWISDIGVIIGSIRSDEGFHIAKVLARRPERTMDFVEVEPMLREQLENTKLEASKSAWFDPLRKKYPVVIFDSTLVEGFSSR